MYMCVLYLPFHHIFITLYYITCFFFTLGLSCSLAFVVNGDTRAASTEVTEEKKGKNLKYLFL